MPEEERPQHADAPQTDGQRLYDAVLAEPDTTEEDFKKAIRFAVKDINHRSDALDKKRARLNKLKGMTLEEFKEYIVNRRKKGYAY